jgi:DNA-directed RNA polymerase subunit RPC12/RpoP
MNQTLEYKPKTGVGSIYFLQLFCWRYNGIRKLIKIVIMEISNMSETDPKYLKFKCPECEHTVLEEVMYDVVQSSTCDSITEEGLVYYGCVSYDCGEVNHYQCQRCDFILRDDSDTDNINCEEELAEWLKQYCPQDKD